MMPAGHIKDGEFFRKKQGTYVYLKISESSVKYMKLDATKIHGVCYNGNMASVERTTLVERCTLGDFVKNIDNEREWHEAIISDP